MDTVRGVPRRRAPLFALFGAGAVSAVGNALTYVAVPWFVLQTTGSAARMGLAGAAIALAAVLAGLFGGPVVDRLGFKRTSVAADLASGVTVAAVPLLHLTVGLAFWQLLVLVFLGSLLDSPGRASRIGLVPDLSRVAGMRIERANSVSQAIPGFAELVGPVLAGVLIASIGASNVLWVDAATFAASAAVVAAFVPPVVGSAQEPRAEDGGYLVDLAEGLGFVRRDAPIFSLVLTLTAANLLVSSLFSVVLPFYADAVYDSAIALGLMVGGFGGGALAGTLLFGVVGHRLPRRSVFVASFAAVGVPLWALVATPALPVAAAALVASGLAFGPLNPLIFTLVQERAPEGMLGRVLGVLNAFAMGAAPLGIVLAGYLIEGVGLQPTLVGVAACFAAVALGTLLNPAFRRMDATSGSGPSTG